MSGRMQIVVTAIERQQPNPLKMGFPLMEELGGGLFLHSVTVTTRLHLDIGNREDSELFAACVELAN